MPVIAFSSPKGGAGKTTAATVLATVLAERGATVTIIDADPNKNVVDWAKLPGKPPSLAVVGDVSEETIVDAIEEATGKTAFVIVDLEGTASLMVSYAVSLCRLRRDSGSGFTARRQAGGATDEADQGARADRRPADPVRRTVHAVEPSDPAEDATPHRGAVRRAVGPGLRDAPSRPRVVPRDLLFRRDAVRLERQGRRRPPGGARQRARLRGRGRRAAPGQREGEGGRMSGGEKRADPFAGEDLDLSGFNPVARRPIAPRDQIRVVSRRAASRAGRQRTPSPSNGGAGRAATYSLTSR